MQSSLLSNSRMFSLPQKETLCPLVAIPHSPFTLAPGSRWCTFCIYRCASSGRTVKVEACSKCLLCLGIFHLAYFHSLLMCRMYRCLILLYDWIIFHRMDTPRFVVSLSVDGHVSCFYLLAIMNNNTQYYWVILLWTSVHSFCVDICFHFSRYIQLLSTY